MLQGLQPFLALDIFAQASELEAEGRAIRHLEIGEPCSPPAPAVKEAVARHLGTERQGYTAAKGLPALREAIAGYYRDQHDVDLDPGRIVVTTGSSGAFILGFLACFPHGAKIGVTRPGYPAYVNILAGLGFDPVEIELKPQDDWRLDVASLAAAHEEHGLAGLMLASPANPTGAMVGRERFAEIIDYCARSGIRLISDEIYHGLNFSGSCTSALEITDDAVVINSFSKYYCLTGWRIGWMVMPPDSVRQTEVLAQSMFISAPTPSQVAAMAALDERAYYDAQRERYRANRDVLVKGLEDIGFDTPHGGDGGFYAYVDITRFSNDSITFCRELLENADVAVTPGVDFDRTNGHRYVRISFASDRPVIEGALTRMADYLSDR